MTGETLDYVQLQPDAWSIYPDMSLGGIDARSFDVAQVFAKDCETGGMGAATGHYRAQTLNPDLQYFDCSLQADEELRIEQTLRPGLCIAVVLKGQWSTHVDGQTFEFERVGTPLALSVAQPMEGINHRPVGSHIRMAGLLLNDGALDRYADDTDASLRALAGLRRQGVALHDLSGCKSLRYLLQKMYDNPYAGEMARMHMQGLGLSAVVQLAQHLHGHHRHGCFTDRNLQDLAFDARNLIDLRLFQLPSVEELAQLLATSQSTLRRAFKLHIGRSLVDYVREQRLLAAQQLLRQRKWQVAQVAYQVGYSNPANFTHAYKSRFGYPPGRE